MEKEKILNNLKKLNHYHKRWLAAAETIILNVEISSNTIPKSYTDCQFGKWFYGDGYVLHEFATFSEIEDIHIQLHKLYLEIYKAQKIQENNYNKNVKKYLTEQKGKLKKLKAVSNSLIGKIQDFIVEINKKDEAFFYKN